MPLSTIDPEPVGNAMMNVIDRPAFQFSLTFVPDRKLQVSAPLLRRAEKRTIIRMFVKLSNPANGKFEITSTIDVSRHGARVVTKNPWQPNQDLIVQTIRGNLYSRARAVHCQPLAGGSYALGLELFSPLGEWTKSPKPSHWS